MSKNELPLITTSEASHLLRVCIQTIQNWASKDLIPHVKDSAGRKLFKLSDLEKFKREREAKRGARANGQ
jgi:excisionase family DNA binding protein